MILNPKNTETYDSFFRVRFRNFKTIIKTKGSYTNLSMAKKGNSGGETAAINQLANTTSQGNASLGEGIKNVGKSVGGFLSKIGEGISSSITINKELFQNQVDAVKEQGSLLPASIANVALGITNLGNQMTQVVVNSKGQLEIQEKTAADSKEEKGKAAEYTVDTTVADPTKLNGLKDSISLQGTGFALLYNTLQTTSQNILGKLTEMQKVMTTANAPAQAAQAAKAKPDESKEKEKNSGGKSNQTMKKFLEESAGPLGTIASAVLHLTLSIAILALLPAIPGVGLASIAIVVGTLLGTFALLALITQKFPEILGDKADPEKKKSDKSNLYYILDAVGNLVLKMSLSIALMAVAISIMQGHALAFVGAFLMVMTMMAGAMIGAVAMANLMPEEDIGESGVLAQTIDSISNLIMKLSLSAILLGVFATQALTGMLIEVFIVAEAITVFAIVNKLVTEANKQNPKQIEQVSNLMKEISNMILITALVAIILGILPVSVVVNGIVMTALIEVLVIGMFWAINKMVTEAQKQNPKQIEQVTNLIKAISITIAIVGVLVIILGLLPISAVLQGMIAVTLMFTLVIVAIKVISKIKINAQVFLTLASVSLFVIAVALLAMLITVMIPDGVKTMLAAAAVVLVTFAIVLIAAASNILVPFGVPAMVALVPFKLLAVALTLVIVIAIAGAAMLLAKMLSPETAKAAIVAATAVILTTTAVILVATGTILLAGLAVPLMFATGLATMALGFVAGMAWAIVGTILFIGLAGKVLAQANVDETLQALTEGFQAIGQVAELTVQYTPMLLIAAAFSMIAAASMVVFSFGLLITIGCMWLISKEMIMLKNAEYPTEKFESFKSSMTSLADATHALDNFVPLSFATYVAVKLTIDRIDKLNALMAGRNGEESGAKGINALADALGRLAQTAPQLTALAQSMKDVAAAAKDISNLDVNTKMSVESMSGSGKGENAEDIKGKLKEAKESQTTKAPVIDLSKLEEPLKNLLTAVQNIGAHTEKSADANYNKSIQKTEAK